MTHCFTIYLISLHLNLLFFYFFCSFKTLQVQLDVFRLLRQDLDLIQVFPTSDFNEAAVEVGVFNHGFHCKRIPLFLTTAAATALHSPEPSLKCPKISLQKPTHITGVVI